VLFGRQCAYQSAHTGEITAMFQTMDKAQLKWVGASQEYNGDRFCRCLCSKCGWDVECINHRHIAGHQFACQR
jgi:hypothetical protein